MSILIHKKVNIIILYYIMLKTKITILKMKFQNIFFLVFL